MRRLAVILGVLTLLAFPVFSQNRQVSQPQRALTQQATQQAQTLQNIQQSVEAYYISRFQTRVGVSNEKFFQIIPRLRQGLNQKRMNSVRRSEAITKLKQLTESNAPEDAILAQVDVVDQLDIQARNQAMRFVANLNTLLTPIERAKFRIFQSEIDAEIRAMIDMLPQSGTDPQRGRGQEATKPAPPR